VEEVIGLVLFDPLRAGVLEGVIEAAGRRLHLDRRADGLFDQPGDERHAQDACCDQEQARHNGASEALQHFFLEGSRDGTCSIYKNARDMMLEHHEDDIVKHGQGALLTLHLV
jgi:hypothetical protein